MIVLRCAHVTPVYAVGARAQGVVWAVRPARQPGALTPHELLASDGLVVDRGRGRRRDAHNARQRHWTAARRGTRRTEPCGFFRRPSENGSAHQPPPRLRGGSVPRSISWAL
jgi:hypothetical protein